MTSFGSCWANCCSLKRLNLNNWNTTNWSVTSLNSTWSNCYALIELKIDQWNTINWKITTLGSTWSYCYSLKRGKIIMREMTKAITKYCDNSRYTTRFVIFLNI